jgi:hypothetical protein
VSRHFHAYSAPLLMKLYQNHSFLALQGNGVDILDVVLSNYRRACFPW